VDELLAHLVNGRVQWHVVDELLHKLDGFVEEILSVHGGLGVAVICNAVVEEIVDGQASAKLDVFLLG